MILIVTNRKDHTADFLILELRRRKADYVRFNTEDFPTRVQVAWELRDGEISGAFFFRRKDVKFEDISSIWYRRPLPSVPDPSIADPEDRSFVEDESQATIDGIWRCIDCFWVSHPDNLRRSENKLLQLKLAQEIGFKIPRTIITNKPDSAAAFYHSTRSSVVYKPLRRGRLIRDDGISLIFTNPLNPQIASQLNKVRYSPSLLQYYVPKKTEIRVTIIGQRVFAVQIDSQSSQDSIHDWRKAHTDELPHKEHSLPSEIKTKCIALTQLLGLEFGAIDLIQTPDDEYFFLEINPNGQWAWIQQLLPNIPLREALADILVEGKSL